MAEWSCFVVVVIEPTYAQIYQSDAKVWPDRAKLYPFCQVMARNGQAMFR